jgi:cytochrome c
MAPVIKDLAALPDQDIRAMATYLASFNEADSETTTQAELAEKLETDTRVSLASSLGARLYLGACAACHEVDRPVRQQASRSSGTCSSAPEIAQGNAARAARATCHL